MMRHYFKIVGYLLVAFASSSVYAGVYEDFFQAVNRLGVTVDAGVLRRPTADTTARR